MSQPLSPETERDRCYLIPSKDGKGSIRIRAPKYPTPRTIAALQELFSNAYVYFTEEPK